MKRTAKAMGRWLFDVTPLLVIYGTCAAVVVITYSGKL